MINNYNKELSKIFFKDGNYYLNMLREYEYNSKEFNEIKELSISSYYKSMIINLNKENLYLDDYSLCELINFISDDIKNIINKKCCFQVNDFDSTIKYIVILKNINKKLLFEYKKAYKKI